MGRRRGQKRPPPRKDRPMNAAHRESTPRVEATPRPDLADEFNALLFRLLGAFTAEELCDALDAVGATLRTRASELDSVDDEVSGMADVLLHFVRDPNYDV